VDRKLAAILAADVVGYSALMEHDEQGTFERVKAGRKELFEPEIARHHGHVFKLMGDGLLAEFSSVMDAVECAVALQGGLAERNAAVPEDQRFEVRIGVNLGEVIVEGDDRFGEGVNIAARLEQIAEPGGIYVSGKVAKEVEKKLAFAFEAMGEQRVKNIAEPVTVYRVNLHGQPRRRLIKALAKSHSHFARWLTIAAVVVAIALVAGVAVWVGLGGRSTPQIAAASKARMAFPMPDKPSIGVLPFTNMSDDAEEQHFADGLTDSLITDLSKVAGLFVISRNSTFIYQGKSVAPSQVAEELGVRYVLEGSVQRAGNRLRVNAQLIDALTGGHVWADRFDGDVADVFAVQDAFVSKIVGALKVSLTTDEKREMDRDKTDSVAAKEAFDVGWSRYLQFNAKDNAAAVAPLMRAVELDPEYGRAYAALALVYFRAVSSNTGWCLELGMKCYDAWSQSTAYLQIAKAHPTSLYFVAQAWHGIWGKSARSDAQQAISLDPNDPEAHIAMAWALIISGEPKEALKFVSAAMRLNPQYPAHYVLARGMALFNANDFQQAAQVLQEGLTRNSQAAGLAGPLASVLALLGRRQEARQTLQKYLSETDQRLLDYTFPLSWGRWVVDPQRVRERLHDGLRLAVLPPDITVASLIVELKRKDDPRARVVAVTRLGWFGPSAAEAVPELIELLKDDGPIRLQVINTLGKIGPDAGAAVTALSALQNDRTVGHAATMALAQIRGN
jgi:TolB-like protein/class 3 adenylate cyclase/Flp pilus assembly protein TadD